MHTSWTEGGMQGGPKVPTTVFFSSSEEQPSLFAFSRVFSAEPSSITTQHWLLLWCDSHVFPPSSAHNAALILHYTMGCISPCSWEAHLSFSTQDEVKKAIHSPVTVSSSWNFPVSWPPNKKWWKEKERQHVQRQQDQLSNAKIAGLKCSPGQWRLGVMCWDINNLCKMNLVDSI